MCIFLNNVLFHFSEFPFLKFYIMYIIFCDILSEFKNLVQKYFVSFKMYIIGILLSWLTLLSVPYYLPSTSEHTLTNLGPVTLALRIYQCKGMRQPKRIMMMCKKQLSSSQKEAYPPCPSSSLGLVISSSLRLLMEERPDSVFVRKCRKLSSEEPHLWQPQHWLGEEAGVACPPSGGLPGASLGAAPSQ